MLWVATCCSARFGVLKPGAVLVSIVQPPSEEEAKKHQVKASMLVTEPSATSLRKLGELVEADAIKPFIGKVYPMTDVAKAWRENRTHHVDGKIVFQVAAEATASARSATASE